MTEVTESAPERTFVPPSLSETVAAADTAEEAAPEIFADPVGWDGIEVAHQTTRGIGHVQVAVTPEGEVHLVWGEDGWLWHVMRVRDAWTEPRRLFAGIQPSMAVDEQGDVHLVFVHDFAGRYQVYYTRYREPLWTLPYEISRTPGISHNPHLIVGPKGVLYAVWEDDTPGFPSIYHAYNPEGHWINAPVPGARGWRPALACDGKGSIHLVWESAIPNLQGDDVYHAQMTASGWTLPENISDSATTDSSLPRVAPAPDDIVHVVWQERYANRSAIGYAFGQYGSWRRPLALTRPGRHHSPQIAVSAQGAVHVLWIAGATLAYRERQPGTRNRWQVAQRVAHAREGIAYPVMVCDTRGALHVAWVARTEEEYTLCYRYRNVVYEVPADVDGVGER